MSFFNSRLPFSGPVSPFALVTFVMLFFASHQSNAGLDPAVCQTQASAAVAFAFMPEQPDRFLGD